MTLPTHLRRLSKRGRPVAACGNRGKLAVNFSSFAHQVTCEACKRRIAKLLPLRPRAVGGHEPDEGAQAELIELWHLSRVVTNNRQDRLRWVIDTFMAEYPTTPRKWVYVWAVDHLGTVVDASSVPTHGDASSVPTHGDASSVPTKSESPVDFLLR